VSIIVQQSTIRKSFRLTKILISSSDCRIRVFSLSSLVTEMMRFCKVRSS